MIVNEVAAIARAIHGEPAKVPTNAGLALALSCKGAARHHCCHGKARGRGLPHRPAPKSLRGTETICGAGDQDKIQGQKHAAMRIEGQNQAPALSGD